MIAFLSWKLVEIQAQSLILVTNGWVGYEVYINEVTFSKLVNAADAELFIYHHITENSQSLFWFLDIADKKVFIELIKISGIGWKVALLILSLGIQNLANAIANDDKHAIESIKWIGKKMAEKIILELKDKDFITKKTELSEKIESHSSINIVTQSQILDTLSAMWYNREAIQRELEQVPADITDIWDIIPYLVKKL